jgi:hypothetical protein
MTLSSRMTALQSAMNQYGEATVENYQTIHAFGDALIEHMKAYLGEGADVMGVPPKDDYCANAGGYRDAKFSTYYNPKLSLAPIQMGLSIGIPHSKDSGVYWPRVVLEFEIEGNAMSMRIGDKSLPRRGISFKPNDGEFTEICEEIYGYMLDVLENPVRTMKAQGSGRFGFNAS